jgi:hypothetical protein
VSSTSSMGSNIWLTRDTLSLARVLPGEGVHGVDNLRQQQLTIETAATRVQKVTAHPLPTALVLRHRLVDLIGVGAWRAHQRAWTVAADRCGYVRAKRRQSIILTEEPVIPPLCQTDIIYTARTSSTRPPPTRPSRRSLGIPRPSRPASSSPVCRS